MISISELSRHWPRPQRQRDLIRNCEVKGIFVLGKADGDGPVLIQAATNPRQKAWQARSTEHQPDSLHALAWSLGPNASRLLKAVRGYLDKVHLGDSWFQIRAVDAIATLRQHASKLRINTVGHAAFIEAIVRQDEINQVKDIENIKDLFAGNRFTGLWDELFLDYAEAASAAA